MKKILAIVTLCLAFGFSANAQDKKVSPESAGVKEAVELTDYLQLNATEQNAFAGLFKMKHEMMADPNMTPEKKKELSVIIEKKIEATLDGNKMEKLRSNPALLKKLTN
ncbi:MAG: hypothetical protein EOO50_16135 [Flavobacterium sp.]|uniref:hypothetical protein n=1 Tax=Flavobacterium sp. TaxID=239 RepID=UPI00122A78C7|nr:hypothetical protein [Flavobacterium sp.]RZJ64285.1 MAG: hypothetical protein EOO50_16135 [Flavobacterium sp.]